MANGAIAVGAEADRAMQTEPYGVNGIEE